MFHLIKTSGMTCCVFHLIKTSGMTCGVFHLIKISDVTCCAHLLFINDRDLSKLMCFLLLKVYWHANGRKVFMKTQGLQYRFDFKGNRNKHLPPPVNNYLEPVRIMHHVL